MNNWRNGARAAYLSAILTVFSFAALIVFYAVGQPFGTINDAASVALAVCLLPVAAALHRLQAPAGPRLSRLALAAGWIGMLALAGLQGFLVVDAVAHWRSMTDDFVLTLPGVLSASGLIGVWLLLSGLLALRARVLSARLAWLGLLAGAGYVSTSVGFWLGGPEHPLTAAGGLLAVIVFPFWAVGLGRQLSEKKGDWP